MPEGVWDPSSRTFNTSSSAPTQQKGDRAGESSAVFDDAAKKVASRAKDEARQKWIAKNFPGLGGRVKMNKDPDWEKRFNEEYAKSQGQKEVLKDMEKPKPTTAASPKP